MPELMLFLLKLLSILHLLGYFGYTTLAHQHSLHQASNLIINITNASSLAPVHSSFHANSSASGPHAMEEHSMKRRGSIPSNKAFSALSQDWHIGPRSIVDIPTELPAPFDGYQNSWIQWQEYDDWNSSTLLQNYQDIMSGLCTIEDSFCSFKARNGSTVQAKATDFHDECILWDDSCSGNRTAAIEKFFDSVFRYQFNGPLLGNLFFQQAANQSDCDAYNPPERLTQLQSIKSWMRSSQCVFAADEWIEMTGYNWGHYFSHQNESKAEYIHQMVNGSDVTPDVLPSCCGACFIQAENVDLYYWPEPDSDTSCLSVIGSVRPIDYGATTENGMTYWACNQTESSTTNIVITAHITTVGSLAVKVSDYNPGSSSPCDADESGSQNQSINARDGYTSVYRRAHSLIVPTAITQPDDLPLSTIVSGHFTL